MDEVERDLEVALERMAAASKARTIGLIEGLIFGMLLGALIAIAVYVQWFP